MAINVVLKAQKNKVIPVRKIELPDEVVAIDAPGKALSFVDRAEHDDRHSNSQLMKMSDSYFNASKSTRVSLQRIAVLKLQSFIRFLRENKLFNREDFRQFTANQSKDVLSNFFGLTNREFDSESGDKFDNYARLSFTNDGNYVTINYSDNFFFNSINKDLAENRRPKWSLQMRMIRGITFDIQTCELVSFPHEKFFNIDEYIDGDVANLAVKMTTQSFLASEKVDGILIHAFYDRHNNKVRFGTRGQLDQDERGFIETAEKLAKKSGHYNELNGMLKNGKSVVLELVDPKYRVVVGYGNKSALFLHGVRDLKSLEMEDFLKIQKTAKELGLESPRTHSFSSFQELYDFQKNTKDDVEGYVLRFEDGSMSKAKTEAYFDKLKGLRALTYNAIGESILSGQNWTKFKYDKIKSEELFEVADRYKLNLIKQGNSIHEFLKRFVDEAVSSAGWEKFGPEEKKQFLPEVQVAYDKAVNAIEPNEGFLDNKKVDFDTFRLASNYLASFLIKNNDSDRTFYNKKLMALAVDSLKTDAWMGGKLQDEIQRSIDHMDLTKDFMFGSMVASGPGQDIQGAGLTSVTSDKGKVYELSEEEKKKRKKQKMLED
jgi:hypothetical protein